LAEVKNVIYIVNYHFNKSSDIFCCPPPSRESAGDLAIPLEIPSSLPAFWQVVAMVPLLAFIFVGEGVYL